MADKEKIADAGQMSEDEWNKDLGEWVEEKNKKRGRYIHTTSGHISSHA